MKRWNPIKAAKLGYILTSILFCAGGLLLMLYPSTSTVTLCYIGGGLMIVGGIIKMIGYFSKDLYRPAFQFDLAFGLLLLAMGLIMVFHPQAVISFLHFLIGIIIMADGLFKIQTAIDARRFGLGQWWLILSCAIITGVCGLLLIINPFQGAAMLMILMGAGLLFEGILNLCVAAFAVKTLNITHYEDDIIDI